jgi:transposase
MLYMSGESLEEFYSQILGFEWPWEVQEIIRDGATREVRVIVSYAEGEDALCPTCGKPAAIHDRKARKWRHLDSCNHKTIIESEIPRVKCEAHGVLQVKVPWAEKNSRFTIELERHVCRWLLMAPVSEVASMFGLGWDAVAGIQERAVRRGLAKRKKASPRNIGVDETSFQKRHEYVTVILDKDANTVLDVLQDRKAETLGTWFGSQEMADLKGLESLSMDMWDPYIKAARESFENWESMVAFDRYHVAQHLNKAVDKVRAREHRELVEEYGASELSGTKFEWLRTSSKMDNRTGGRPAFMQLSRLNLKTARAWRIKETAALLWDYAYPSVAEKRWKELLSWISRSKLEPMIKAGRTIRRYFWGILNAIRLKASNAMLEAVNSGIQRIKRMACGFRNRERFRMAILFHFGGLDLGF